MYYISYPANLAEGDFGSEKQKQKTLKTMIVPVFPWKSVDNFTALVLVIDEWLPQVWVDVHVLRCKWNQTPDNIESHLKYLNKKLLLFECS